MKTTTRLLGLLCGALLSLGAMADHYAILTGGSSDVYYPVGQKLKVLLDEAIPEHRLRVVSTQASVENFNNNFFVTSVDLPEVLAYRITRAIFDNLDRIHAVHPAAWAISLERALAIWPIDVHPGALSDFRELGLAEAP